MEPNGNKEGPHWVHLPTEDIRAPLLAEAVATPRNATALRRRLHDWLSLDLPAPVVMDLALAAYEAVANATEHAYAGRPPGPVQLEAHRAADHVLVAVSDRGHWRAPTGARFRGRGMTLMRMLAQNVHTHCDHRGTVVHLRLELTR